jgi:hypothetical protein
MKIQIDDEIRNATAEEQKTVIDQQVSFGNIDDVLEAKTLEKAKIFAKLGITPDEAAILLG